MKEISVFRRENARKLMASAGGAARFAERVAMSVSQVSQLLGENFTRNIGGRLARKIEAAFDLEVSWLDRPIQRWAQQSESTPQNCLYERRKFHLARLIESNSFGSRVAFCNSAGIDESRLGQLLSAKWRNGQAFGERAARNLEKRLGLPALYFEREIPDHRLGVNLELSIDEVTLVTRFRFAKESGKKFIMQAANFVTAENM